MAVRVSFVWFKEILVKRKIAWEFFPFFLGGFLFAASGANAQAIAYRQINLASDVNAPGFANNVDLVSQDPWGIAFQPRGSVFIANKTSGRVSAHDATGASARPGSFIVSKPSADGAGTPTGIVADANLFLEGTDVFQPFITATEGGAREKRIEGS
jgi:hypothetical protein